MKNDGAVLKVKIGLSVSQPDKLNILVGKKLILTQPHTAHQNLL